MPLAPPTTYLRWLTLGLILVLAAWLRLHDLARRPMHADEANQAVKLGELLESGHYAFDPRDHHGPSLYYAAVPIAWLRGQRTLAALDETTVRLVPAFFGTAAVLLLYLLVVGTKPCSSASVVAASFHGRAGRPSLPLNPPNAWPALAAAAFLAVSPPAVYYSRYYIQEALLVTLTLAALLCASRAWCTRRLHWAILAGVAIGLMQATKASTPLFLAAAALAFLVARPRRTASENPLPATPAAYSSRQLLLAVALSSLATAALLYSSFFTHLAGIRDALTAYTHAFTRFGADAPATGHEKPFAYYLRLFGWFRNGGLVWHQLAFSALAASGLVIALLRRRRDPPLLFAATFTLTIILVFSIFAYKTPWHTVHFIPGLAVLAATAVAAISRLNTGRPVAWAFALITVATLFQQTQRVAFLRPADQRNPYAYVHSSADVLKFRPLANAAVARAPDQPIRVISEEYWPLPWYFRGIPHTGYYATPPDECDGALVVVSPMHVEAVRSRFKQTYRETFLGLRPGVILVVFTRDL